MKYGIVAFPSKELQEIADGYRKRYDPHYALISPHMTIKGVFNANDEEIEEVVKAIKEVTSKHSPFELNIAKVGTFAPITNAIYFKATPSEELSSLHKSLNFDFFGEEPPYAFVPHVTIAQKLTSGEHDDIIGQLKMIGVDHTETIDTLYLVQQLEDGSWTAYETLHLEGNK